MDPISASFLIMGGMQVMNGLNNAEFIRMQNDLQQRINEMNARSAELQAWEATRTGEGAIARYQNVIDKVVSAQTIGYVQGNINVNTGTAQAIREETKVVGFLNTIDMRNQAANRALQLKTEASNIRLQGEMQGVQSEMEAISSIMSGLYAGAGTALSAYQPQPKAAPSSAGVGGYQMDSFLTNYNPNLVTA